MKEEDLHRAKCPTNISDRRRGEGGGGVQCQGKVEVRGKTGSCLGLKEP